jgi:hypothetical protein
MPRLVSWIVRQKDTRARRLKTLIGLRTAALAWTRESAAIVRQSSRARRRSLVAGDLQLPDTRDDQRNEAASRVAGS